MSRVDQMRGWIETGKIIFTVV